MKYGSALKKLQTTGIPEEKNSGIQEDQNPGDPEQPTSGSQEALKTGSQEAGNSGIQGKTNAGKPEKEKYSTLLPSTTVEALKLYAVRHRMKDWEVVDAALRAYLRDRE
ncbi:hypothetical protein GO986_16480 [Deinococcus sp. HMF7620]|uniref:Uncharacterized protein n=1 Tax=Deinococcus arboris TaxID=2682977 RepID=A0A7C9MAG0_9DEIO|nr:hypothetical protein [Deinococcus arboris]MVN88343.1 hypothetical protein [Deinococcus arboris]